LLCTMSATPASAASPYTLESGSQMSFTSSSTTMGPFTLSDDCVDFIDNGSQSCGPFEDSLGFFEIDLSASTEYDSGSDEIEATDIAAAINGPCTIELSGTYTLSNAGNDSWVTAGDPIGEYSL